MTLEELKNQLTEIGSCEIKVTWMHGLFIVRVAWSNGVAVSACDTDIEQAVAGAIVLGARRGRVS